MLVVNGMVGFLVVVGVLLAALAVWIVRSIRRGRRRTRAVRRWARGRIEAEGLPYLSVFGLADLGPA